MPNKNTDHEFRQFLSRGEAATLLGMLAAIFSLFLPWERHTMPASMMLPISAVYVHDISVTYSGINTTAHWPVMICGIGCSMMLLWTPNLKNRLTIGLGQGVLAGICLIMSFLHFAFLPGVILGCVGGILMTYGAVDRYSAAESGNIG